MATAYCPVKIQANHLFIYFFLSQTYSLFDDSKILWTRCTQKQIDLCVNTVYKEIRTKYRPFCALRKGTTKRNQEYMVCICLFIANENPIVDQGFFFFRFFFFHSTTHSNISVYVLSSPYYFCFCWLAGLLRTLQLTTIHLKCQNILHIFFL